MLSSFSSLVGRRAWLPVTRARAGAQPRTRAPFSSWRKKTQRKKSSAVTAASVKCTRLPGEDDTKRTADGKHPKGPT